MEHIKSDGEDPRTAGRSGYRASISLQPQSASVRAARRFLAEQLATEGADLVETATLLVSELVTNAVRHARTETIVGIIHRSDRVRIEVNDRSVKPARLTDRGVTAPSGRGLRIVAALASAWGVNVDDDGKVVWFELVRETRVDAARAESERGGIKAPKGERGQRREWRLQRSPEGAGRRF